MRRHILGDDELASPSWFLPPSHVHVGALLPPGPSIYEKRERFLRSTDIIGDVNGDLRHLWYKIDETIRSLAERYLKARHHRPAVAAMLDGVITGENRLRIASTYRPLWARDSWPAQVKFWRGLSFSAQDFDHCPSLHNEEPLGPHLRATFDAALAGTLVQDDDPRPLLVLQHRLQKAPYKYRKCLQALLNVRTVAEARMIWQLVQHFDQQAKGFGI